MKLVEVVKLNSKKIDLESSLLKEKIELVSSLIKSEDYENALNICNELVEKYTLAYEIVSERAFINYSLGKTDHALADLQTLIDLRPDSPTAYVKRAVWNLEFGNDLQAINDLTVVILMGDEFYIEVSYFYRAIAYIHLGMRDYAYNDYVNLSDDFNFRVKTLKEGTRFLSKEDIKVLCLGIHTSQ